MEENNINLFEDLTPTDEADENNIYATALKSGIDNVNVKNIALAGAYGSGKSSILKTFEKKNKDTYTFLNISLADFKGAKEKENIDVERSILQKMFYTVKHEDIPFSRFKRIRDLSKEKLGQYSLYSFIWIFSFWIFYENKDLPDFLDFFKLTFVYYIAFLITLIGIYQFLPKIIHILGSLDLSKINFKKGEVDLAENTESSILNKNLDEILYFFKVTNIDIVILEDLDRNSDNIEIFMKLREMCLIINNSQEIDRKITFIYAIKDNNFQDEDRTKFFDLIIPVIPVIDYSNSADELRKMLKKYKKVKNIDKNKIILTDEFINEISLYIDSMRLLKNIFNEFIIYKDNLNNEKLKNCKLFSLLVYKNLFPNDFAKLSSQDGLLYSVLSNKKDIINKKSKVIDIKIEDIQKEIKEIKNVNLIYLDELKNLYVYYVLQKVKVHNNRIIVDDSYIQLDTLQEETNFEKLKNSVGIRSEHTNSRISFADIKDDIYKKTYQEREKTIIHQEDSYIEELKINIEEKEKEKQSLNILSLNELLKENSIEIFDDKFKDKGLLVFLLTVGYIDETYMYYISHFYEESISKNDRDFILALRGRQGNLGYDFRLDNIDKVAKQIHEYEFEQEEILNCYLFEYLLENTSSKYTNFINRLVERKNLNFIDKYIEFTDKNLEKLFQDISTKTSWLWSEIESSDFTKVKKDMYLKNIFLHVKVQYIRKMSFKSQLSNYISSKNDFISSCMYEDIDIEKLGDILEELDIKFESLETPDKNLAIFENIYKYENYKITYEFIKDILNAFDDNKLEIEEFDTSNYSTINKSSCTELKEYIEDNISEYIGNVFLKIETNTQESEKIIINLLNNENIKPDLKVKIIEKQDTRISDISKINSRSLWDIMTKNNKIESHWSNILYYYKDVNEIDDDLIIYLCIESNAIQLTETMLLVSQFSENNEMFDAKIIHKLLGDILTCQKLSINIYEHFVKSIIYTHYNLDISTLDEEKIALLVSNGKLGFKNENFNKLKENTDSQHIALIEKNIDKYLDEFDEFILDTNDVIKLLESKNISTRIKKEIIEKIDYDLITNSLVAKLVYSLVDKTVIRSNYYTEKMLNSLESIESRVNLIVEQEEEFTNEELSDKLKLLPKEYSKISNLDGKQTVLNDKNYNKDLIKLLHTRGFITKSKEEKKKRIRLYIKRGSIESLSYPE